MFTRIRKARQARIEVRNAEIDQAVRAVAARYLVTDSFTEHEKAIWAHLVYAFVEADWQGARERMRTGHVMPESVIQAVITTFQENPDVYATLAQRRETREVTLLAQIKMVQARAEDLLQTLNAR